MASAEYQSLRGPKRLGDRLLEAGLISRTQLDLALECQQTENHRWRRLGRTLVELGHLSEPDLTRMLSLHLAIPVVPFSIDETEEQALARVPPELARRHQALPCRLLNGSLLVAVADALTPAALEELESATGSSVLPCLVSEIDLVRALAQRYGAPPPVAAGDPDPRLEMRLAAVQQEAHDLAEENARLRAELERLRADTDAALKAVVELVTSLDGLAGRIGAPSAPRPDRNPAFVVSDPRHETAAPRVTKENPQQLRMPGEARVPRG